MISLSPCFNLPPKVVVKWHMIQTVSLISSTLLSGCPREYPRNSRLPLYLSPYHQFISNVTATLQFYQLIFWAGFNLLLISAESTAVKRNRIAIVWFMIPGCFLADGYSRHVPYLLSYSFSGTFTDIPFSTYFTA